MDLHASLRRVLPLGLISAALLPLACAPAAPAPPGAPGAPEAPIPLAPPQPKVGGIFRIPLREDPPNLDPQISSVYPTTRTTSGIYSGLVRMDAGGDVDYGALKIVPDLAERWEQPDKTTFLFHLRKGAKWHNVAPVNGREVDADDILFAIKRYSQKDKPYSYLFADIDKLEAVDRYTVKMVIKKPFSEFLTGLADPHAKMVPRETEQVGDLKAVALGSGGYKLKSYERGVRLVWERNPDYFLPGQPYLQEVHWLMMPEMQSQTAAFRGGELDNLPELSPTEAKALRATTRNMQEYFELTNSMMHVAFNVKVPPFDNVKVRQAISLGLDRQALIDTAGQGEALLHGPIPVGLGDFAFPQEELRKLYPYDPQRARQLLAEAGFPNGFKATALVNATTRETKAASEVGKDQLAKIGVDVELDMPDYATYLARRADRRFDMGFINMSAFPDPHTWLYGLYWTGNPRNYYNISDPDLEKLIAAQAEEYDVAKRKQIIFEAQRMIIDKAYLLPLLAAKRYDLVYPYVRNFRTHYAAHSSMAALWDKVWLDK